MIEQISNALMAVAFYADSSGTGVTGLTVTVDAYRVINTAGTPVPTQVLTAAAATAIGGGLYGVILPAASVTVEAEYVFIFKTTSTSVAQKQLPAMWTVAVAGVENLDSPISTVQADTDNIQTRLPAALVSGRIDASVGAMAANTVTATAIQDDAITAAKIAADAIGASELAASAVNEIADQVWDEVTSGHVTVGTAGANIVDTKADTDDLQTRVPATLVSGRMDVSVGAMAANTLTATAIQDDAITAAKIAANAIGSSELATSALNVIADAVWDEALAGHLSAGSTGLALDTAEAGGGGSGSTILESITVLNIDGMNLVPYGSMISNTMSGSITDVVVPARATHIAVQAVDEDIWYTDDGSDPTEDHGMVIYAGQAPRLIRLDEFHNDGLFRFLRSADGSSLRYRYYRPE